MQGYEGADWPNNSNSCHKTEIHDKTEPEWILRKGKWGREKKCFYKRDLFRQRNFDYFFYHLLFLVWSLLGPQESSISFFSHQQKKEKEKIEQIQYISNICRICWTFSDSVNRHPYLHFLLTNYWHLICFMNALWIILLGEKKSVH